MRMCKWIENRGERRHVLAAAAAAAAAAAVAAAAAAAAAGKSCCGGIFRFWRYRNCSKRENRIALAFFEDEGGGGGQAASVESVPSQIQVEMRWQPLSEKI
jgi:hypothetical protein